MSHTATKLRGVHITNLDRGGPFWQHWLWAGNQQFLTLIFVPYFVYFSKHLQLCLFCLALYYPALLLSFLLSCLSSSYLVFSFGFLVLQDSLVFSCLIFALLSFFLYFSLSLLVFLFYLSFVSFLR